MKSRLPLHPKPTRTKATQQSPKRNNSASPRAEYNVHGRAGKGAFFFTPNSDGPQSSIARQPLGRWNRWGASTRRNDRRGRDRRPNGHVQEAIRRYPRTLSIPSAVGRPQRRPGTGFKAMGPAPYEKWGIRLRRWPFPAGGPNPSGPITTKECTTPSYAKVAWSWAISHLRCAGRPWAPPPASSPPCKR